LQFNFESDTIAVFVSLLPPQLIKKYQNQLIEDSTTQPSIYDSLLSFQFHCYLNLYLFTQP